MSEIKALDAVKRRSHRRSSSTSDAFHDKDDLITVYPPPSLSSLAPRPGAPVGLPNFNTSLPLFPGAKDDGDDKKKKGMVNFLKTGGTRVLEKSNKMLVKVSSKNRKKDLMVHIPGGGNNASCDDAMEYVHENFSSPALSTTPPDLLVVTRAKKSASGYSGPPSPTGDVPLAALLQNYQHKPLVDRNLLTQSEGVPILDNKGFELGVSSSPPVLHRPVIKIDEDLGRSVESLTDSSDSNPPPTPERPSIAGYSRASTESISPVRAQGTSPLALSESAGGSKRLTRKAMALRSKALESSPHSTSSTSSVSSMLSTQANQSASRESKSFSSSASALSSLAWSTSTPSSLTTPVITSSSNPIVSTSTFSTSGSSLSSLADCTRSVNMVAGEHRNRKEIVTAEESSVVSLRENLKFLEDWARGSPMIVIGLNSFFRLFRYNSYLGILTPMLASIAFYSFCKNALQAIVYGESREFYVVLIILLFLGVAVYRLCHILFSKINDVKPSSKEGDKKLENTKPQTPTKKVPETTKNRPSSTVGNMPIPTIAEPKSQSTTPRSLAIDPKKCYASGKGLQDQAGKVGEQIEFLINVMTVTGKKFTKSIDEYFEMFPEEKEMGGFRVDIEGRTSIIPTLVDNKDGTITVTYNPRKTGAYELMITFGGRPIQAVPILVNVVSGDIEAGQCVARGRGLGGSPVTIGETLDIKIETYDHQGHPRTSGGSKEGFAIKLYEQLGSCSVTAFGEIREKDKERELLVDYNIVDNSDGTYTLSYYPSKHGLFRLVLSFCGTSISETSIFVIPDKLLQKVAENVKKKRVIFKAKLVETVESLGAAVKSDVDVSGLQKIQLLLTPQQIAVNNSYVLGLFSKRIATWKTSPSLKISLDMHLGNELDFKIDHKGKTYKFSCKKRDEFYGTVRSFINEKVGRSYVFEDKRVFFCEELRKIHSKSKSSATTPLQVDRKNILKDAYTKMKDFTNSQWRGPLYINFIGESGVDTGGITKEFFSVLGREIFNPDNSIFRQFSDDSPAVHPAPLYLNTPPSTPSRDSLVQSAPLSPHYAPMPTPPTMLSTSPPISPGTTAVSSLDIYKFAGKFLAKCIYDTAVREPRLINILLTKAFYKLILHLPVDFSDFATDDPQYFTSKVKYILENNIDEANLCLNFVEEEYDKDGKLRRCEELRPNGNNIPVTEENKIEYLQLLSHFRLYSSVMKEVTAFREGFYSLIPEELISMFDENELELLICGLPNISVDNMKEFTQYSGGLNPESKVVKWFWNVVENFSQEELARLLQFVTGSSQLPLEGFSELKPWFTISKSFGSVGSLPHAHTCLNQLDLPDFKTCAQLQERLILAITNFSEGFGFA